MKSIAIELGTTLTNIQETNATNIQPWTIKQPELFLELNKLPKQNMHPHKFQENFQGILENYADNTSTNTDDSKCENATVCAAVSQYNTKKRFRNGSSIFTAEA